MMGDLVYVDGQTVVDVRDNESLRITNQGPQPVSINGVSVNPGSVLVVSDTATLTSDDARVYVECIPRTGASSAGPQGPKGDKGDDGEQGPSGDAGVVGERGPAGADGAAGAVGATGSVGPKGDTGDTGQAGAQGPQGLSGAAGAAGAAGAQGPAGDTGPQGPQGLTGLTGSQGVKGDTGAQGLQGIQGTQGIQGIQGVPGVGLSSVKIVADQAFSTVNLANVTGLAFAVLAGTLYEFEVQVIFRAPALTTGIKLGLVMPAFTTFSATVLIPFAADGSDAVFEGVLTTSGDSVVSTAVPAINTDYLATITGQILPSAGGTVQLQAATEVAASAVTVRNGSLIGYSTV